MSYTTRMIERPIFIGGSGRSGTSVLGHLLSSHPDIIYFSEPRFFIDKGGVLDLLQERITIDQFCHEMTGYYQEKLVNSIAISISTNSDMYNASEIFSVDIIKQILSNSFIPNRNKIEAVKTFVQNIFYHGMVAMKKNRCVEKTPHTFLMAPVLYEMFPDMKYIHAIRDPKDVYCSMLHHSWGPNSVTEFIPYYMSIMARALHSLIMIPQNQLLTVELENLVKEPIDTIRTLFDLLDLPYSSEQLSTYANIIRNPNDGHIYRYLKELSSEDSKKIDQCCRDLYLELCDLSNR